MKGLNFETKMGQVAMEIAKASTAGRDADLNYLQGKLGEGFSRKEIADSTSSLYKRGYLERLGLGRYRATQKLRQQTDREQEAAGQDGEPSAPVIVRKKSREKAEAGDVKRQESELDRLGNLLDRLESCLDRLENISLRLDSSEKLQGVMDSLQEALAKGRGQS
ncbi:MAG: hypothetical protein ACOC43_07115 [Desulfohalobiaceae bacterium]